VPDLEDPDAAFFERSYAGAVDDLATVPWAVMAPRAALVTWLDTQPAPAPGGTALVVGYGDDAEDLVRRGRRVTAFDDEPVHDRPWPVGRADLAGLEAAGLRRMWFTDTLDGRARMLHGTWTRP
jgi:hypothetical protein